MAELTVYRTDCMVFHMKTTLVIDDGTMRALKSEAARRGQTMSQVVEGALRMALRPAAGRPALPPLPRFHSGGMRVDVADRGALHDVMGR